jgi:hypothetical protein
VPNLEKRSLCTEKERSELSELLKTLKGLKRGRERFKAIATIAFDEDVESNTIMSDRLDRGEVNFL